MTTRVEITNRCDAKDCSAQVSEHHWTALGAQSHLRGVMRRAGWETVTEKDHTRFHYCPEHVGRHDGHRFDAHWRGCEV